MPKAELLLWGQIRKKQMGVKFLRQYGVGPYVFDFYCPMLRLAIELDGDSHFNEAAIEHDRRRGCFLIKHGITTIRFTNDKVYDGLDWVVERIREEVENPSHAP